MWRDVGVRRDRAGLAEAAEMIDRWCRYVLGPAVLRARGLGIAEHAVRGPADDAAALEREETRGVHLRTDFPRTRQRALAAAHFFRRESH